MRLFRPADHTVLVALSAEEDARPLLTALAREGYGTLRAKSSFAAIEVAGRTEPSIIVMDGALPDAPRLELCRRLRADLRFLHTPIIIVSGQGDEDARIAGFESGADDYLVKPFSVPELLLRVRARIARTALERKAPSPRSIRCGTLEIQPEAFKAWVEGNPIKLSAQELRLLLALVGAGGRAVSRKDLEKTFRRHRRAASRAVDSGIKRLRSKLGAAGSFIQPVRGMGYRFALGEVERAG
jgi:two-component system phosphate regulon response regulator PhoB